MFTRVRIKRMVATVLLLLTAAILFLFISNNMISATANRTFSNTDSIPYHKVGLVLGTSRNLQNGSINPYYKYRVDAAIALFKAGKISYVIVSGDNSTRDYDEPTDFKRDLVKGGIPEERIFLDYAGFRTLDSVVRARAIFGQAAISIISQQFHNERAIFLADHFGIEAVGFNATRDVPSRFGMKVKAREYLARAKVFWDLIFHVQPKFLGEKISID